MMKWFLLFLVVSWSLMFGIGLSVYSWTTEGDQIWEALVGGALIGISIFTIPYYVKEELGL